MFNELFVKNFILIDELNVDFIKGLNILTGETGSGKSVLFNAINLLMGAKFNKEMIKAGKDEAQVRGVFVPNSEVAKVLDEIGIPNDEYLIISRQFFENGKSVSRVNGQLVNLSHLKMIGQMMIDVHGQHEQYSLLEKDQHIEIIDNYANEELVQVKNRVAETAQKVKEIDHEIDALISKYSDKDKQLDYIQFQINEIEQADLKVGEDEQLEKTFELMDKSESIVETLSGFSNILSGEMSAGILEQLSEYSTKISDVKALDTRIDEIHSALMEAFYCLEDLTSKCDNVIDDVDFSKETFYEIEQRLDLFNNLKTKYGMTIEEIIDYKQTLEDQVEGYQKLEDNLEQLKNKREVALSEYKKHDDALSLLRKETSEQFIIALQNELVDLNMKDVKLKVNFKKLDRVHKSGSDEIEFLISTNIGQPMKPMGKVVSGGELSRIMLGIKIISGDTDRYKTMVFDEIDTGISGQTAKVVGQKLYKVSKNNQVFCVTHLPQIAVYSDAHYKVSKASDDKQTKSDIRKLDQESVITELCHMINGHMYNESIKNSVKEMIWDAKKYKTEA